MVIFITLGFITARLRTGYGGSPTPTHPGPTMYYYEGGAYKLQICGISYIVAMKG